MLKDDEFMKSDFAGVQETYFGFCLVEFRGILPCESHSSQVSLKTKQKWQLSICADIVNLSVFYTAQCNIIIQCKPTKCTFPKLIS